VVMRVDTIHDPAPDAWSRRERDFGACPRAMMANRTQRIEEGVS